MPGKIKRESWLEWWGNCLCDEQSSFHGSAALTPSLDGCRLFNDTKKKVAFALKKQCCLPTLDPKALLPDAKVYVNASANEILMARESQKLEAPPMETGLRAMAVDRCHFWHVQAGSTYCGVDFLGFPSWRLTVQGEHAMSYSDFAALKSWQPNCPAQLQQHDVGPSASQRLNHLSQLSLCLTYVATV
eukprot:6490923-Amphidinium_carterae.3